VEKTTTPRLLRLCLLLDDGNSTHNDDDEFILSLKLSWGVKAVVGGEIHFFLSLEPFF